MDFDYKKFVETIESDEGYHYQLFFDGYLVNQGDDLHELVTDAEIQYGNDDWHIVNTTTGEMYNWSDFQEPEEAPEPEFDIEDEYEEIRLTPMDMSYNSLMVVWAKFTDIASSVFPDGDPIDLMLPKISSRFSTYGEPMEILEYAAKAVEGTDVYGYLANMWDGVYRDARADYEQYKEVMRTDPQKAKNMDAPVMYNILGGARASNPWRVE